jgi:hypothetical protein
MNIKKLQLVHLILKMKKMEPYQIYGKIINWKTWTPVFPTSKNYM